MERGGMRGRRLATIGIASLCTILPLGAQASLSLTDWNGTGFDLSYGSWIPLNTCLTTTGSYAEISGTADSAPKST